MPAAPEASSAPEGVASPSTGGVHATRRGWARHELSARVTLTSETGACLEGWALNVSRGGIRVILEENVELGAFFTIAVADGMGAMGVVGAQTEPRRGRIVWVQEEPDGVVAGIAFDLSGDDR